MLHTYVFIDDHIDHVLMSINTGCNINSCYHNKHIATLMGVAKNGQDAYIEILIHSGAYMN